MITRDPRLRVEEEVNGVALEDRLLIASLVAIVIWLVVLDTIL